MAAITPKSPGGRYTGHPASAAARPFTGRLPLSLRRVIAAGLLAGLGLVRGSIAAESSPPRDIQASDETFGFRGFSLLPKAFQRRPHLDFNILTEMTDEGRQLTSPTSGQPVYYTSHTTGMMNAGSAPSGIRKVPPVAVLEEAMKNALAGASYLPSEGPDHPPSLVVIFTYGSHAIDPDLPPEVEDSGKPRPVSAEEWLPIIAHDVKLQADILQRAALIGGPKLAQQLKQALVDEVQNMNINYWMKEKVAPVSPDRMSPFQLFFQRSTLTNHLIETAFHTCYFVVASAYDQAAMSQGQKRLLWRTKMTVDAQGVSLEETLRPLVASATPFFGRDMSEAAIVSKRIMRGGNVEIGESTVLETDVKDAGPDAKP